MFVVFFTYTDCRVQNENDKCFDLFVFHKFRNILLLFFEKIDFNAKMSCFVADPSSNREVRLTRKLLILSKRFQFPKKKCFLWVHYFSDCVKQETYKRMLLYQMLITHLIRFLGEKIIGNLCITTMIYYGFLISILL